MCAFIDAHRDEHGVEPICRILQIAPSSYYAHRTREPSARQQRDEQLTQEITQVHEENYGVYGARKMWHAMRRAGWGLGRDPVARLMRNAGLHEVRRGRKPNTTRPAQAEDHRPDLV